MGNRASSERRASIPDEQLKPALYEMDASNQKRLRRKIMSGNLAPCYKPAENQEEDFPEECPICLLYYPCLNRSTCCMQSICTECYVQVGVKKPGTRDRESQLAACPFCKREPYVVKFRGALTDSQKQEIELEKQKFNEAKIRMRQEEIERDREREECRQSQNLDEQSREERDSSVSREQATPNRTVAINSQVDERNVRSDTPQPQAQQAVPQDHWALIERGEPSPLRNGMDNVALHEHLPPELFSPELLPQNMEINLMNDYLLYQGLMNSIQETNAGNENNQDDAQGQEEEAQDASEFTTGISEPIDSADPHQWNSHIENPPSGEDDNLENNPMRVENPSRTEPLHTDSLSTNSFCDISFSSFTEEEIQSDRPAEEDFEQPCPGSEANLLFEASFNSASSLEQSDTSSQCVVRDANPYNPFDVPEISSGHFDLPADASQWTQEEEIAESSPFDMYFPPVATISDTSQAPLAELPIDQGQLHEIETSSLSDVSPAENVEDTGNSSHLSNAEKFTDALDLQTAHDFQPAHETFHPIDEI